MSRLLYSLILVAVVCFVSCFPLFFLVIASLLPVPFIRFCFFLAFGFKHPTCYLFRHTGRAMQLYTTTRCCRNATDGTSSVSPISAAHIFTCHLSSFDFSPSRRDSSLLQTISTPCVVVFSARRVVGMNWTKFSFGYVPTSRSLSTAVGIPRPQRRGSAVGRPYEEQQEEQMEAVREEM